MAWKAVSKTATWGVLGMSAAIMSMQASAGGLCSGASGDSFTLRGYSVATDLFLDGVRDAGNAAGLAWQVISAPHATEHDGNPRAARLHA